MYSLQTSVQIGQASFEIRNKGDFRMVLDCFEALNDPELSDGERLYSALIIFYEDFNSIVDVLRHEDIIFALSSEMMKFFNCGEESCTNTDGHKLIDWNRDSNLICSAVNNVAKQEVRALDYLHWWTFVGYYTAIGDSPLTTIIGIRSKIAHGEKLDKAEQKFRNSNPEYFDIDMRSSDQQWADDYVKQLWGGEH